MKIIIDIDERAYKASLELKTDSDSGLLGAHLINATANGIPLENIKEEIQDLGIQGIKKFNQILNKYIKEGEE